MSGGKEGKGGDTSFAGMIKKRVKVIVITFAVMLLIWLALLLATEDSSVAPFVYAIF
ncbi:MAG: hypothetical protein HY751_01780 [Nitrospinae bacterium]|nr:hypothetical protein [Nitrospinota bacterium]